MPVAFLSFDHLIRPRQHIRRNRKADWFEVLHVWSWTFASRCITMQYKGKHFYGTSINDAIACGPGHQIGAVGQTAKTQAVRSGPRSFGTISGHPTRNAPHRTRTRSSRQRCQWSPRLGSAPPRVPDAPVAPWPLSSCWIPEPSWRSWTETRSCTMTVSPPWKIGPAPSSPPKRY